MTEQQALASVDFEKGGGLVPVVVQDVTGQVCMLGYQNRQALELTLQTGRLHFWSRSRQEIWLKGEKSGNYLLIRSIAVDCDGDALLTVIEQATGTTPICHTGKDSCFFTALPFTTE